ncbi:MAG TPA: translesion DNA synthesis-associated protein ImuA [Castellaniella sp.]|uniref:translesion DNA synthesis-associated protein ImuA n=1 Tax=Castellaniella sp. TaxID=1955812 RepID=UPI002F187F41
MPALHPEHIHPALWRASQLATGHRRRLPSGHVALDEALKGGWPLGTLIELLPAHPGIGEVRLLRPALQTLQDRRQPIILLNPPYLPSAQCWAAWGLCPEDLLLVRADSTEDTTWAAAQILYHQSSAALLCWVQAAPYADLLKLHSLARRGTSLVVLYRSVASSRRDSPASLRIALQAHPYGVSTLFLKYPGPLPAPVELTLYDHDHALDQPDPAAAPGSLSRTASIPVSVHATHHPA